MGARVSTASLGSAHAGGEACVSMVSLGSAHAGH